MGGGGPRWRGVVGGGPAARAQRELALAGLVEGWPDAERVGVAELIGPADAAARVAAARPKGPAAAGVLRPLPRRGEQTP